MHETIAVIFDFDDTLAPDSTSGLLKSLGADPEAFWRHEVEPLMDSGWDPALAYLHRIIAKSKAREIGPITQETLFEWGKQLPLHPGAQTIFTRLRSRVREVNPRVAVEFYLISSGIGDILRHTPIASEFNDIWASEFDYDAHGHIHFPKRVVSFTDKTRYIFQVQKGIFGPSYLGKPFEVNRKFKPEQLRIPIPQMIFVGDGYTDIPCFSLITKQDGVAIGVYDRDKRERWGRAWGFIEDQRVNNLAAADYSDRSGLTDSLFMAVESLARRIDVQSRTYQG